MLMQYCCLNMFYDTKFILPFFPLLGAWRTATEEWGTEDWNEDVGILELVLT